MVRVPLSLTYSHNLALLKQSPGNTVDQNSTSCRRAAATICSPLSSLCGRRSASPHQADHACRVQTAT